MILAPIQSSRREALRRIAAGVLASTLASSDSAWAEEHAQIRAELDLSLLDDWNTPSSLFFQRSHYGIPHEPAASWLLEITGSVSRRLAISVDQLLEYPRTELPALLESADNPPGGGLASQASWEGVTLSSLLAEAAPTPEAASLTLVGRDQGPDGAAYTRSLPLSWATSSDALVAYRMNGKPLPPEHGAPVRLIVPGCYGLESVKWLKRIELHTDSLGQAIPEPEPIKIKSVFARPRDGAVLFGRSLVLRGAAWAGPHTVAGVEVSGDGGRTWIRADLEGEPQRYCWTFWACPWRFSGEGAVSLLVRAKDSEGNTQPLSSGAGVGATERGNSCQSVRCTLS